MFKIKIPFPKLKGMYSIFQFSNVLRDSTCGVSFSVIGCLLVAIKLGSLSQARNKAIFSSLAIRCCSALWTPHSWHWLAMFCWLASLDEIASRADRRNGLEKKITCWLFTHSFILGPFRRFKLESLLLFRLMRMPNWLNRFVIIFAFHVYFTSKNLFSKLHLNQFFLFFFVEKSLNISFSHLCPAFLTFCFILQRESDPISYFALRESFYSSWWIDWWIFFFKILDMGTIRGGGGTLTNHLSRGNTSSPSLSAGTFLGFGQNVGERLTPTISTSSGGELSFIFPYRHTF